MSLPALSSLKILEREVVTPTSNSQSIIASSQTAASHADRPALQEHNQALHSLQKRRDLLIRKGWIHPNGLINRSKEWPTLELLPESISKQVQTLFSEQKEFIARTEQFTLNFPEGISSLYQELDRVAKQKNLPPAEINILGGFLLKVLLNNPDFFKQLLGSLDCSAEEIQQNWLLPESELHYPLPLDLDLHYWLPIKVEVIEQKDVLDQTQIRLFQEMQEELIRIFGTHTSLPEQERSYRVRMESFEKLRPIFNQCMLYFIATLKLKKACLPRYVEFMLFGYWASHKQDEFYRQRLRLNIRPILEASTYSHILPRLELRTSNLKDPLDIYQALLDQCLGYDRAVVQADLEFMHLMKSILNIAMGCTALQANSDYLRVSLASMTEPERKAALLAAHKKLHNDHQQHFPEGAYTFLLQTQLELGAQFDQETQALWQPESTEDLANKPAPVVQRRDYFRETLEKPSESLLGFFCRETQKHSFSHTWVQALFGSLLPLFTVATSTHYPVRLIKGENGWIARWNLAIDYAHTDKPYSTSVDFSVNPVTALQTITALCKKKLSPALKQSVSALLQKFLSKMPSIDKFESCDQSGWCDWQELQQAALDLLSIKDRTLKKLAGHLLILAYRAHRTLESTKDLTLLLPQLSSIFSKQERAQLRKMIQKDFIEPPLSLSESALKPILDSFSGSKTDFQLTLAASQHRELCALAVNWVMEGAGEEKENLPKVLKAAAKTIPNKVLVCFLKEKIALNDRDQILATIFEQALVLCSPLLLETVYSSLAEESLRDSKTGSAIQPQHLLAFIQLLLSYRKRFLASFVFCSALEINLLTLSDSHHSAMLATICRACYPEFSSSTISAFWLMCHQLRASSLKPHETELPFLEELIASLLQENSPEAILDSLKLGHLIFSAYPKIAQKSPWKLPIEQASAAALALPNETGLEVIGRYRNLPVNQQVKRLLLHKECRERLNEQQWGKARALFSEMKSDPTLDSVLYLRALSAMPLQDVQAMIPLIPPNLHLTAECMLALLDKTKAQHPPERTAVLTYILQKFNPQNETCRTVLLENMLNIVNLTDPLKSALEKALSLLVDFTNQEESSWKLLTQVHLHLSKLALSPIQLSDLFRSFAKRLNNHNIESSLSDEAVLRSVCKQKYEGLAELYDSVIPTFFPFLIVHAKWTVLKVWLTMRIKLEPSLIALTPYLIALAKHAFKSEFLPLHADVVAYTQKIGYQSSRATKTTSSPASEWYQNLFVELLGHSDSNGAVLLLEYLDPQIKKQADEFWRTACHTCINHLFSILTDSSNKFESELLRIARLMETYGASSLNNWIALTQQLNNCKLPVVFPFVLNLLKKDHFALIRNLCSRMSPRQFAIFYVPFNAQLDCVYAMLCAIGNRPDMANKRSYPLNWSQTLAKIISEASQLERKEPQLFEKISLWHFERLHQIQTTADPEDVLAFQDDCLAHDLNYIATNYTSRLYLLRNCFKVLDRFFSTLARLKDQAQQVLYAAYSPHFCQHLLNCTLQAIAFRDAQPTSDLSATLRTTLSIVHQHPASANILFTVFQYAWQITTFSEQQELLQLSVCLNCFVLLQPLISEASEPELTAYFSKHFALFFSKAIQKLPLEGDIDRIIASLSTLHSITTPQERGNLVLDYLSQNLDEALKVKNNPKQAVDNVINLTESCISCFVQHFDHLTQLFQRILFRLYPSGLYEAKYIYDAFVNFLKNYKQTPYYSITHLEDQVPNGLVVQGWMIRHFIKFMPNEYTVGGNEPLNWGCKLFLELIEQHPIGYSHYYMNLFTQVASVQDKRQELRFRCLQNEYAQKIVAKLAEHNLFVMPSDKRVVWSSIVPCSHYTFTGDEREFYVGFLTDELSKRVVSHTPSLGINLFDAMQSLENNTQLLNEYQGNYKTIAIDLSRALKTSYKQLKPTVLFFLLSYFIKLKALTGEHTTTKKIMHEVYTEMTDTFIAILLAHFSKQSASAARLEGIKTLFSYLKSTFALAVHYGENQPHCKKNSEQLQQLFDFITKQCHEEAEVVEWSFDYFEMMNVWLDRFYSEQEHQTILKKSRHICQHMQKRCTLTSDQIIAFTLLLPRRLTETEKNELVKTLCLRNLVVKREPRTTAARNGKRKSNGRKSKA